MQIIYFQSQVFYLPFMFLKSAGFKFCCKKWKEIMFFVFQVILALTLQATLKGREKFGAENF